MSDLDEIQRLMSVHGLGDAIFDEATDPDELKNLLSDLGVEVDGANPPRGIS